MHMQELDFGAMPKGELHAHLNGCIPLTCVRSIVEDYLVPVPKGFEAERDLRIVEPVEGLDAYFRPWVILKRLAVNREALNRIVDAAGSSLAQDGVVYGELRNSLTYISHLNGVDLTTALEWLLDAYDRAACTHLVDLRLIVSLRREEISAAPQILGAIRDLGHHKRLVGVDLTGNEAARIDSHASRLFRTAKEELGKLGLGVTIHAGETGPPENVVWAATECRADRIGHALAIELNPSALDLVLEAGTCIEVCITSNLLTGCVKRVEDHPVRRFMEHGVPFVLCSDNPELHGRHLSAEYRLFFEKFGRADILEAMYERQHRYSFATK